MRHGFQCWWVALAGCGVIGVWCAARAEDAGRDIRFGWDAEGVAVAAADEPVNRVLETISAATGIPMQLDPAVTNRLNGLYRQRTLEDLLLEISPGLAISYAFDPRQSNYVIEHVYSAAQVPDDVKQAQLRQLVVTRDRLERGVARLPLQPVRYSGIGAAIQRSDDGLGVWLQPLTAQSPAARAGLQLGDLAIAIDGRSVASFTNLVEITNAIRGPEHTVVSLTIRHPDGSTQVRPVRREVFAWTPGGP